VTVGRHGCVEDVTSLKHMLAYKMAIASTLHRMTSLLSHVRNHEQLY